MLKQINQGIKSDKTYDLPIFLKNNNTLIGVIGFSNILRSNIQSSFFSYTLYNVHWNNGYCLEAVNASIHFAFKHLNLHRLEALIEPNNKKSLKLIKKTSFRREGLKKKINISRGKWRDHISYALTSEDLGVKWKNRV